MKPYVIKVPAGGSVEIAVGAGADYVRAQVAPAELTVHVLDTDEQITLSEGDDVILSGFSRVSFSHGGVADLSFTVLIGRGTRATRARVAGSVALVNPTGFGSVVDNAVGAGATVQILAADATRVRAIVTNLAASVNTVRVGDAAVAAGQGTPIEPGQTMTVDGGGAVHVYNPAGGVSTIAVTVVTN